MILGRTKERLVSGVGGPSPRPKGSSLPHDFPRFQLPPVSSILNVSQACPSQLELTILFLVARFVDAREKSSLQSVECSECTREERPHFWRVVSCHAPVPNLTQVSLAHHLCHTAPTNTRTDAQTSHQGVPTECSQYQESGLIGAIVPTPVSWNDHGLRGSRSDLASIPVHACSATRTELSRSSVAKSHPASLEAFLVRRGG